MRLANNTMQTYYRQDLSFPLIIRILLIYICLLLFIRVSIFAVFSPTELLRLNAYLPILYGAISGLIIIAIFIFFWSHRKQKDLSILIRENLLIIYTSDGKEEISFEKIKRVLSHFKWFGVTLILDSNRKIVLKGYFTKKNSRVSKFSEIKNGELVETIRQKIQ